MGLLRVRQALGFSQRDMAQELGVTHGAIGLWESRARPLPGPVLKLIALFEEQLGIDGDRGDNERPLERLRTSWASRTMGLSRTAAQVAAQIAVGAMSRALVDDEHATAIRRRSCPTALGSTSRTTTA